MITLSNTINIDLMLDITRILREQNDMTLKQFYVEENPEDNEAVLYAYYPATGHYVGRHIPVNVYRLEHVTHAQAFANDLNTLFGLIPQ